MNDTPKKSRLRALGAGVVAFLRDAQRRARFVGIVGAIFVCLAMTLEVLGPMFENWHTYGFHDWDTHTAYRYGTILSLTRYHEGPWWAPWLCGGYASWGYVEGATNLVSPYLPFYLLFKMPIALRIEVVGSAIFGFVGTYVVAGRFTRSAAVRALVAVLFAMNGRWSLQIASGHTWHLQYAWLPWLLYFYDVSLEDKRFRQVVYGGICLAMMVYMGGIYPLPQSALLLVVFGALSAIFRRSLRPILTAALISVIGVGLSAPKLLPMLDGMSRAPRIIESPEAIDLRQVILMMASPSQSFHAGPVMVPSYGWHEWGIYIGWFGVTVLVLGLLFARGKTGHPLKLTGALFFVLGLGAFLPESPWTLLHKLPVFASQHVPSRFLHPAILLLGLSFAVAVRSWLDPFLLRRPLVDALLLVPVAFAALDIAAVGRVALDVAFPHEAPPIVRSDAFKQQHRAPASYPAPDWAQPVYLAMLANQGVIDCWAVPRPTEWGAIGEGMPGYRGEAYVEAGTGEARVVSSTPNTAEIQVDGATEGAVVVYNMNYDPSWRANGKPAMVWKNAVAARVPAGSSRVRFTYYPRTMNAGLAVFAVAAGLCGVFPWWRKRRAKRKAAAAKAERADGEAT